MVVGLVGAVAGAVLAERPDTEAIGTFATELGAAMLFAGAVFLVVSRAPTVGRIAALVVTALVGVLAIGLALLLEWESALLALSMELGVAAVALLVIDVVLMGLVFPKLDDLADGPGSVMITLRLDGSRAKAADPRPSQRARSRRS
jgi:hypothetical protein